MQTVPYVVERLGLFVGVNGLAGEVINDLLPEAVAVFGGQAASRVAADDRMEIVAIGGPVVLQQAAALQVTDGTG